jgi:hypothetical protein
MYRKITSDTETASLLAMETAGRSAKPFLCELAQEVFRKENGEKRIDRRILHAFSQFKSQELARIIDAKRDGVFDYGEFIIEVPGGYQYPKAADALKMLLQAEGSSESEPAADIHEKDTEDDQPEQDEAMTSSEESMDQLETRKAELLGMKARPLQRVHLEVTGNRTVRGETKTEEGRIGIIDRILAIEFNEGTHFDPRPAGPVVEINTVPTTEAAVVAPPESVEEASDESNNGSVVNLSSHFEEDLVKDEPPEAETLTKEGFAYEKSVLAGLRGIFVLVDILRRNQDALANDLLEHGTQNRNWSTVPPELVKDYDTLVASIESEIVNEDEIGDMGAEFESGYEGSELQKEVAQEVQEFRESIKEEMSTSDNGHSEEEIFAKNYTGKFLTIDELRDMDTHDLQHYATEAGVENATAQAFTPILIRQVLKRLDSIKSIKESLGQSV